MPPLDRAISFPKMDDIAIVVEAKAALGLWFSGQAEAAVAAEISGARGGLVAILPVALWQNEARAELADGAGVAGVDGRPAQLLGVALLH